MNDTIEKREDRMSHETYREMMLTSPKRTWTESQTVRALVLEYARWNWPLLAMSYLTVTLIVFVGGFVRIPILWMGTLGMISVGVSMMMHDLTSTRRLGAILGLGVPSRTIARAMWYEAVIVPGFSFFLIAAFSAVFWGLGLRENTLLSRLLANGVNALIVAAFCSIMVRSAVVLGPPTSSSWRDLLRNGAGAIVYMATFTIAAVAFGYVCYLNFDVLVHGEVIRFPWHFASSLLAVEAVAAIVLILSARGAAHRLLVRHVRVRKDGAATSVPGKSPPTRWTRRQTYGELLCREAVRQGALALSIPIAGVILIAVFLDLRGYDPMQRDLLVAMAGWMPVLAVFWTARRLAQWLSALSALRMLPWRTGKVTAFVLAAPMATGIVAGLALLVLAFVLGVPIHPGWAMLVMWVPALGYLLFPRSGVGILGGAFFLWGIVVTTGLGSGAAMPVYGVGSLAIAVAMVLQTRRLIRSDAIYRQRDFAFLGEERN